MHMRCHALKTTAALLFVSLLAIAPQAASQGLDPALRNLTVVEQITTDGNLSRSATSQFSENALKMEVEAGRYLLIRFDLQKVFELQGEQKGCVEMSFQTLQGFSKDKLERSPAQTTVVTSVQRAGEGPVTRELPAKPPAAFTVTRLGAGDSIAGHATERYRIAQPGGEPAQAADVPASAAPEKIMEMMQQRLSTNRVEMEVSVAQDLKLPAVYYDAMQYLASSAEVARLYNEMKKIAGMPLKSVLAVTEMGRTVRTASVVVSIEKRAIPPSAFEAPQNCAVMMFGEPGQAFPDHIKPR